MADILTNAIDMDELRARWGAFEFTAENKELTKLVFGEVDR